MKYVVRVAVYKSSETVDSSFLECLRYAGLVRVHKDDGNVRCFDLIAPNGVDSKVWSETNARRMTTFGYNAVSAPSTERL